MSEVKRSKMDIVDSIDVIDRVRFKLEMLECLINQTPVDGELRMWREAATGLGFFLGELWEDLEEASDNISEKLRKGDK